MKYVLQFDFLNHHRDCGTLISSSACFAPNTAGVLVSSFPEKVKYNPKYLQYSSWNSRRRTLEVMKVKKDILAFCMNFRLECLIFVTFSFAMWRRIPYWGVRRHFLKINVFYFDAYKATTYMMGEWLKIKFIY